MIKTKFYSRSSKGDNAENGRSLGLKHQALNNFCYAGYEIVFDVEIDEDTGDCFAVAVNGAALESRVKI